MRKQITVLVFVLIIQPALSQNDSLPIPYYTDSAEVFSIPLFTTDADEAEAGAGQQDISGLLQASRDVFAQFASFQFGQARFRMRGLSAENHQVMINGIDLSNPETGFSTWSVWGGLNHVTRFTESRFGNTANRYGFSGIGGYTNIDSRASSFKKGTRLSYTSSGRIYRHRLMLTHYTGMSRRGWAFSVSGSFRNGNEVAVPGTHFRAWALYFAADKKLNNRNQVSLTAFIAPVEQGRQSASVLEAYTLSGDNNYNSSWGWQNGKVRSAKVSRSSKPTAIFSHTFRRDEKTSLVSSICFQGGSSGFTGINASDAPNAMPDYYKYLPSYHYLMGDSSEGDRLSEKWHDDPAVRQINWDRLITMNKANLYSDPNSQTVNTTETRARYLLENRVEQQRNLIANILWNRHAGRWHLSAGVHARHYSARKFKVAEDLLGASFWVDEDQFADNLGVEDIIRQNDIDNPFRKVRQGEKFGYDYSINIRKAELWAQAEYSGRRFDWYAGASLSTHEAWRLGHVANGKFPVTSKGRSPSLFMLNGGVKAGLTFKISGRQYLDVNGTMLDRAPGTNEIFVSPTTRNSMVSDLASERVTGVDLSYNLRAPYTKIRFTIYRNSVCNQIWLRTYWHDNYNSTVNMIMKNVNNLYQGFEFALEKNIAGKHIFQGAIGYAGAVYTGQPTLEAWQDNNSEELFRDEKVYLNNYRSNSAPQLATGISYRYNARNMWFAALSLNYFDRIHVDVNPYRRTEAATGKFLDTEKQMAESITAQQTLPAWYLMNFSMNKSFRLKNRKYISVNLSINNVLNNRSSRVSGFEQLRWNPASTSLFPPKYSYLQGRSYMLIITYIL